MASVAGGAVLLAVCGMLIGPDPRLPYAAALGLGAFVMATLWVASHLARDFPHADLGLANIATLGRLVIVSILFVVLLEGLPPAWPISVLAVLALCLDGIDGWLARKQGLASQFGARFDVEVDAAFALVLAALAATQATVAPYVILLGLPYYLFGAARTVLPWLDQPLPDKLSRKAVCVFQIGALIALQVPVLADAPLGFVIATVTAALIWSFGRDILWLWRASR